MKPLADTLTRRFPRPLSNAHVALPIALVAAWCFLAFATPCRPGPRHADVVLATSTVFVALWVAHLRAQAFAGWQRIGMSVAGAAYDLGLLLALFVVCSIPLVMLLPAYDCMTPRNKAALLVLSASPARVQVEERVASTHTLRDAGKGIVVTTGEGAKSAVVTDDGMIVVAGDDPPAVVIFQPTLVDGKVAWTCRGSPPASMPAPCRP